MYIHWVTRTEELTLTSSQKLEIEKIFGAVRTMHNMVTSGLTNVSKESIISTLLQGDVRDTFQTLNKNVAMVRFADLFIHEAVVDVNKAEIMKMADNSILTSHVAMIAQSWVEYLCGERQRPEHRDGRDSQSFWQTMLPSIIMNDHSLSVPSPSGDLYFEYREQDTYGIYAPVVYRFSRHDERYFISVLYEKEIEQPFETISGIKYPNILNARGESVASLKYEVKHNSKMVKEEQLQGMNDFIMQIRRFALNRLTKRKESTLFYP